MSISDQKTKMDSVDDMAPLELVNITLPTDVTKWINTHGTCIIWKCPECTKTMIGHPDISNFDCSKCHKVHCMSCLTKGDRGNFYCSKCPKPTPKFHLVPKQESTLHIVDDKSYCKGLNNMCNKEVYKDTEYCYMHLPK